MAEPVPARGNYSGGGMSALTGLEVLVLGASCHDDGGGGIIMTSPEGITVAARPAALRLTDKGALYKQKKE